MGSRLKIFLTHQQDKILLNLRSADVPQKLKDRAKIIILNAHGWYVEKIAAHFVSKSNNYGLNGTHGFIYISSFCLHIALK